MNEDFLKLFIHLCIVPCIKVHLIILMMLRADYFPVQPHFDFVIVIVLTIKNNAITWQSLLIPSWPNFKNGKHNKSQNMLLPNTGFQPKWCFTVFLLLLWVFCSAIFPAQKLYEIGRFQGFNLIWCLECYEIYKYLF